MVKINLLKWYHKRAGLSLFEAEDFLELRLHDKLVKILGRRTSLERILEIADGYVTK